jgi:Zn-dependent peptidase ImmA (M78 family)/plasmid maintenance system antidote protein VapI
MMSNQAFQPDWFSKPGDTIVALVAQRGLTLHALAVRLKCDMVTVRGLLVGTVDVDESMAVRLSRSVGGTPSFWRKRQSTYETALARCADAVPKDKGAAWVQKFPLDDIANYGWVERPKLRGDAIRSYLAYFDVTGPHEWEMRYADFLSDVAFKTSPSFESKIGALSAWLRQGELEAVLTPCAPWNPNLLRRRLADLRTLTKAKAPAYFVPRLRAICAAAGVAVVFVRAPSGCRASGAARFVSSDKAIVILSFRYLSDDHFWFTFFHEIGHLIMHGECSTFVDFETTSTNDKEIEANTFAAGVLVPRNRHDELVNLLARTENVVRFAISVGVSPGIVVGQLQHLGVIGRHQLNFLKRRYNWDQIASAFA